MVGNSRRLRLGLLPSHHRRIAAKTGHAGSCFNLPATGQPLISVGAIAQQLDLSAQCC